MRNDYEFRVGRFNDSIMPSLKNFRDLPKALPELESLKNETILTVCTGGVRCEKASGFLVKNGFTDVYQLDGGIVTYMEKFERESDGVLPRNNFKGSLYVFDKRMTMAFASPATREMIGTCEVCGASSEYFLNCANDDCHRQFIVCRGCAKEGMFCPGVDHMVFKK